MPTRRCSSTRRATAPRRSGAARRSTSSSRRGRRPRRAAGVSLRTAGTVAPPHGDRGGRGRRRPARRPGRPGGRRTTDQWAGQLTLVEQPADAASVVEQAGASTSRPVGGTARASSSGGLAQIDQGLVQHAARGGGLGSQTAMQVVYVGQDGSVFATTTQHVGNGGSRLATSGASATNRALVVQDAAQRSVGASGVDVQDLTQESIVVQVAIAASTSTGGIGGRAVVGNCAIVQQGAVSRSPAGRQRRRARTSRPSAPHRRGGRPVAAAAPEPAFSVRGGRPDVEPGVGCGPAGRRARHLFHFVVPIRPSAAAPRTRATPPRVPSVRSEPGAERPVRGRPDHTDFRPASHASAPRHAPGGSCGRRRRRHGAAAPAGGRPTRVGLRTRSGSSVRRRAVGDRSDPPAAFVLVPPLLLRAREGSAVRRPIDALSRVDVPV